MLIFWDAQRLVREYVFLAAWDFRRKPMKDLVWSDQIFFQRLIAVIHAYVGDVIPHTDIPYDHTSAVFGQGGRYDLEVLEKSPINETDRKTILEWLFQWRDKAFQTPWTEKDFTWSPRERSQMIHILLMQRFEVRKCLEANSGWLECSKAGGMTINACKSLYNPFLEQANERVDRIIALLLGSSFKGTFTVTELVKKHQYPKATDDEVFDWQIDNY
ncbi:MAG: hypothetical protein IKR05_01500 [Prevotella sp.]|nr:hypothetical protein [Prevotella sp.]